MMFTLRIETGNTAFGENITDNQREIARILRDLADRLEQGEDCGWLMDANGNKVGTFSL